ncbi:MAG: exosortase O [Myxococcota bacterium]
MLLASWAALHREALADLWATVSPSALRMNLVLGVGLLGLVVYRGRSIELCPALRPIPLMVVLLCLLVQQGLLVHLDIDLLSGLCLVAGAWGQLGLLLPPLRWRQTLPLALATACILPLGPALDLYLGFPLRLATATLIHAVLEPLSLGPGTAETIVVLEGAGVQIDLPCSGVRSLWSGALLWTAATFIERRRIDGRWVLAGALFAGLLVALNAARVLALVLLHSFGPPVAMEILHVPLGLGAFATAGVLGWALLRWLPPAPCPDPATIDSGPPRAPRSLWVLAAVLVALAALPSNEPAVGSALRVLAAPEPAMEPLTLHPDEIRLLEQRHAQAAGKWRFSWGPPTHDRSKSPLRGQLVMVLSRSWRSQHRPDICHAAHGRTVDREEPVLLAPQIPARRLLLRHTGDDGESIAYYWFQSAEQTTNEYGTRIWAALDGHAEPWMMVSVMLDTPPDPDDPRLRDLLLAVHAHAHAQLDPSTTLAQASP